jgi:uncharacterized DUF497 family protein
MRQGHRAAAASGAIRQFGPSLRARPWVIGAKRRANLRKHGIDLAELEPVFDLPMITVEDDRLYYGEMRLQSLGMWRGRVVLLVWTPRGDAAAHLISCRYADRTQAESYFSSL